MFDDDQETPNTLNCAFEFNESGKQQDDGVRSAPLDDATAKPTSSERGETNTIGNLFYGSKGYLAVDSYTSYKILAGHGAGSRVRQAQGGRRPLPELHRRRAQPQARET